MTERYDTIGTIYDRTRRADPFILRGMVQLLRLEPGKRYLDLACGTGNYSTAMSTVTGIWTGMDISRVMLGQASQKKGNIDLVQGDALELPFADDCFDGIACTLAIHHFGTLTQAFSEVRRTLRDEGSFVLFSSTTEQMHGYWLQEYFPKAMVKSWEQMPSRRAIELALEKSGLEITEEIPYFVTDELADYFLYSGKQRPEMYLDPTFRQGISTFTSLADPEEVDSGCALIAKDIRSGKIKEVISEYENDLGDYMFFVCG